MALGGRGRRCWCLGPGLSAIGLEEAAGCRLDRPGAAAAVLRSRKWTLVILVLVGRSP
jgi:hypothetical protein